MARWRTGHWARHANAGHALSWHADADAGYASIWYAAAVYAEHWHAPAKFSTIRTGKCPTLLLGCKTQFNIGGPDKLHCSQGVMGMPEPVAPTAGGKVRRKRKKQEKVSRGPRSSPRLQNIPLPMTFVALPCSLRQEFAFWDPFKRSIAPDSCLCTL